MPLDEREKKELAKRIKEQRSAMWKGEVKTRSQTKKKRDIKTARRIPDHEQGREKVRQYSERQQDDKKTEQSLEQPSGRPRIKKKSRDSQSKIPALKLALLVIIGLITAILLGVGIGYLAAVRDWIPV